MKRLCKRLIQLDILLCVLSACGTGLPSPSPGHHYQCEGIFICAVGPGVDADGVVCEHSEKEAEALFTDLVYQKVEGFCEVTRVLTVGCTRGEGRCYPPL